MRPSAIMLAGLGLAAGCERFPVEWQGSQAPPVEESAQCVRDDDCVLLPSALTCCLECPPVPPFEPAPAWVLDGMLIESETDCAANYRPCRQIRCEAVQEGCVAHARCDGGRCIAVSSGCDLPRS